jgi:toxin ParE1/3/4
MTLPVIQRERARADLLDLVAWIAADNPKAALALYDGYEHSLDLLAGTPQLGRLYASGNPQLASMRVLPVHRFRKVLILYRPLPGLVEIVRILHGSRNIPAILEEEP